jgi:hypothetical protein
MYISTRTLEFAYPAIVYDIDFISPALEIERLALMQSLVLECKDALGHIHKNIDFENILPRWIMLQFGAGTRFADPVFPVETHAHTYNNTQLAKDLLFFSKHKILPGEVDRLIQYPLDLASRCFARVQHLRAFIAAGMHLLGTVRAIHGATHTTLAFVLDDNLDLALAPSNAAFKLRNETYQKLMIRVIAPDEATAHALVFCLVARYHTLNSHNQQLAVLPELYAFLKQKHNVDFELMGSPLNCFFSNYCSLFGDIERHFGSRGNFNNIELVRGFYTLNPPFDEEIMRACAERVLVQLFHQPGPLSVLFIIPVWDDPLYGHNECALLLQTSPFLSAIERIEKKRARFFDHYLRKHITPCDIFLILVQNPAGARQHTIDLAKIVARFFPSKTKLKKN